MPQRSELRKVKLTQFDDGSGPHNINAYFHQWGTIPYPTDDGKDFGITVGIVELETGEARTVKPVKRIKFVDSF